MPPFDPAKHPIAQSLNWFTDEKINDAQRLLAKSWPASVVTVSKNNTMVTVKIELRGGNITFPQLTCPVSGPQYIRYPIQPGDKGVVFCCDYAIWGVTGEGKGNTPDLSLSFNSSNGVFFPIGNTAFTDLENQKMAVLYGPDGAVIRASEGDTRVEVDAKGNVTIYGAKSITTDCFGYGSQVQYVGGTWIVKNYTQGITPTNLPPIPPKIPKVTA